MAGMENKYFNRELSWLEFNKRVLAEALRSEKPLLERLKFLTIVSRNFDEFFMVRVATLKSEYYNGNYITCPGKMSPEEQLKQIYQGYRDIVAKQYSCLLEDLLPGLERHGFVFYPVEKIDREIKAHLKPLYHNEFFPLLTPVRVSEEEPMVKSGNMRLHIGFLIQSPSEKEPRLSVVQLPSSASRIISLPSKEGEYRFTFLENLVILFAQSLFPGYEILEHMVFRITRDADFAVDESRDEDFVEAMEQVLHQRSRSEAVRLSCTETSEHIKLMLQHNLGLRKEEVFLMPDPLELNDFMDLVFVSGFEHLGEEPWKPVDIFQDREDIDVWEWIKERDRLLHHPFESFDPVIRMVNEAADDASVLAIKMTLYRTSRRSPIVAALERAAKNGKQVAVLVELKARFDEARNIQWAERLERAGGIVVYGIAELKVHAKALLVIRREPQGISRYLHIGTGNYNDKTAKFYTDYGFLTSREDLAYEAGLFFNSITGYSAIPALSKLSMAPYLLKQKILQLIEREIQKHSPETPGYIGAKLNSIADTTIIDALYRASGAGIKIDLNVRGICMLVPGVKGLSENIRVHSVIDRYLEHQRVSCFHNGGEPEVYISSADWMARNLDRRVELLCPVEDPRLMRQLINSLKVYMDDTSQSYKLLSDGTYSRIMPKGDGETVHAQRVMYDQALLRIQSGREDLGTKVFSVRRRPPEGR